MNQSAPLRTIERHAGDRLDVVDDGRAGVEAGDRGERRLEPRLAAAALEGVEQRRLLAADVGAGAGVDGDLEVEAGAEDVLAEVAGGVGLLDRAQQPAVDVHDLAAHVDEGVVAADRVGGDDHALDQRAAASAIISGMSLQVPGSDSSALTTR